MNYTLTYYPWITQHKPLDVIRTNVEILAIELQRELQSQTGKLRTIIVAPPLEVPSRSGQLCKAIVKLR